MADSFYEATTTIFSPAIQAWKESGKKIVGYTCSYVPAEIFYAVGILPVRIRGIETEGMDIGDAYFGPFICSFPKCILQLAGKGKYRFLDGTIITPGCDAMRRLDECWRKAGEDYQDIVPPFFYYFDVPHKTMPHGMKWFREEIQALITEVEKHFQVTVGDEALRRAIALYNRGRQMLRELEELRTRPEVTITGSEAFAVAVAGTVMPRDVYTEKLGRLLESLKTKPPVSAGKKRILIIGSISDDIEIVELIEKNPDALVVAENLCFGVRYEGNLVAETGDPVTALAESYLGECTCPRMFGKYKDRLAILKEKIAAAAIDGVIMQNIRFCDLHGSEHGLLERDLEKAGVPCLKLEREYGPLTDTGRMQMRIQAFLERISK
jgi:benzoyl-CoA reductase/2-hydroxyglutaryl-CoA dehydratase subunit BcrC/BadD/HgdB